MVFNMKKKEIILGVIGVILLVVLAFFVSNAIHKYNVKNNKEVKENESVKKEKQFKIDGKRILFKTYRVDQSFFLNVPSIFKMLDEATLKEKYNYNTRPELVFTSADDLEHIFISTTDEDMTDEGLKTYLDNRVSTLTNMTVLDNDIYPKYDKTFAKLVAYDTNTYYNLRFFTLNNKLVTVEFNTPTSVYLDWEDVVNEVMNNICFDEDDIKKYSND